MEAGKKQVAFWKNGEWSDNDQELAAFEELHGDPRGFMVVERSITGAEISKLVDEFLAV